MPGWMKHKLESRLPGEISITSYADDTTLMAESEELKSLLVKVKEESGKTGLKLNMKTLESPLDCKEIQPVHSKGDQSWVFFGRNDAEAETPVLWPPHAKS